VVADLSPQHLHPLANLGLMEEFKDPRDAKDSEESQNSNVASRLARFVDRHDNALDGKCSYQINSHAPPLGVVSKYQIWRQDYVSLTCDRINGDAKQEAAAKDIYNEENIHGKVKPAVS